MLRFALTVLVMLAFVPATFAINEAPLEAQIDANIAMLGGEGVTPEAREAAIKMLIANADLAETKLRALGTDDPEFMKRIAHVLQFVGGGEVVDGLRIRLSLDKQTIRPGETVHVTTTLMNLTDKPMQIEVGYTTSGNYFEAGSAFTNTFAPGSTGQAAPLKPASNLIGVCGTGAHAIVKTIEPMSTLSYKAPLTYAMTKLPPQRPVKQGEQPAQVKALKFTKNMFVFYPVDTNGTVTFTVQRTNRDIRPKPQPKPQVKPQVIEGPGGVVRIQPAPVLIQPAWPQAKIDADKPFWHGTMKSNTVQLKLFTQQVG